MFLCALLLASCGKDNQEQRSAPGTPTFTLAWSEYVSWSTFGVAHEKGLINGKAGEQGTIEKKYGVDIVLKLADYDTCLTLFGSNSVDASCQTNIDSLSPCLGRASVVILPTSTSVGADACIAVGYEGKPNDKAAILEFLRKRATYGLEKSVSQYTFERNLVLMDKSDDLSEFAFKNMDPAAAAQAMQTKQPNINSIMVWNPFVLQTLRTRTDAKVLFDSSTIPEEIIDCVVVSRDSLNRPGGKQFALAVIETYFTVCNMLNDEKQADATFVALGSKFCNLNAQDMRLVCKQTQFYDTPTKGMQLMKSSKFQSQTMPMVVDFCSSHGMLKQKPKVGFNKTDSDLNFDDSYLREFQNR